MEVKANGDVTVHFDESETSHTYRASSQYKLQPVAAERAPSRLSLVHAKREIVVTLNDTVNDTFDRNRNEILRHDPLAHHECLSILQSGTPVGGDAWSSLQFNYNDRRKSVVVTLVLQGELGQDRAMVTFEARGGAGICRSLMHGGVGMVGNYRGGAVSASEDEKLDWFFGPASERVRFTEYFVQSSHNTFILGQQLKLSVRGKPIDIVYVEACPIALNLGYRLLELDVWLAQDKLVVRHGRPGGPSNGVGLDDALEAIREWMEREERAAPRRIRLPIVFSIENCVVSVPAEAQMAAQFEQTFGERLVRPAAFRDPILRDLASLRRRVIIKSRSVKGALLGAPEWASIVAMWKPPVHPLDCDATVCTSVEASSGEGVGSTLIRHASSLGSVRFSFVGEGDGDLEEESTGVKPHKALGAAKKLPVSVSLASSTEEVDVEVGTRRIDTVDVHVGGAAEEESRPKIAVCACASTKASPQSPGVRATKADAQSKASSAKALALDMQRRATAGLRKALVKRAEARPGLPVDAVLMKVYPPAANQLSENFDPTGAFDARASFISLNVQGKAVSGRSRLTADVRRGVAAASSNMCRRDSVRSVEKLILKEGYDGYMRKDAWAAKRSEFQRLLAAEDARSSLWARLRVAYSKRRSANAKPGATRIDSVTLNRG